MNNYNFSLHSNRSDWKMPFRLDAKGTLPGLGWEPPDDEVLVGISMDGYSWDDYGFSRNDAAPFWSASSNDGSGVVTLVMPTMIDILVPASAFARIGVGTVNIGVKFHRASTDQNTTLLLGRLPLRDGII